jgi:biotin carboxyl carrier protein
MKYTIRSGKKTSVTIDENNDFQTSTKVMVGRKSYTVKIGDIAADGHPKTLIINQKVVSVGIERSSDGIPVSVILNGMPYDVVVERIESTRYRPPKTARKISGAVTSNLPGQILRTLIKEGDTVKKGQPLLILESMKMENEILAPKNGRVVKLLIKPGQIVMKNHLLLEIE